MTDNLLNVMVRSLDCVGTVVSPMRDEWDLLLDPPIRGAAKLDLIDVLEAFEDRRVRIRIEPA